MKVGKLQKAALALLLSVVAGVANASIVRTYTDPDGSGVVTYTDLGSNVLQIEIDNTSASTMSSIITGLVFDIDATINTMTVTSFADGNGVDLSGAYNVALNVNNNITPNNMVVDLAITTTNGINGGIYNAEGNSGNIANTFPDNAILTLSITDPNSWTLNAISNDILRMQRTGVDGQGSLKIPGVPVPAAVWLFGSGLLGLVGVARRKRA
jgi:hypothetical protein